MNSIASICGVAILSLAVASCGGGQDDDPIQSDAAASSVTEPVSPTIDQSSAADPVDAPRNDTLPGTASPMPLVGVLGALLVGGAMVLRRHRRD